MVKPIKMQRVTGTKSLNFESIIQDGQNPLGYTVQTPNGTGHAGNCPGWNRDQKYTMPEVSADGVWANSNRSAE